MRIGAGSQYIGFSPEVLSSTEPHSISQIETEQRVQAMKATARLMFAVLLHHTPRNIFTDGTQGVASGTTSDQAGLVSTSIQNGDKASNSGSPSSSGAIEAIGSTIQSQSGLGNARGTSTDLGWCMPGWDPVAEKHLRLSMILLTAKHWLQRLLLDGLRQDTTLVHADASSAVSELLHLLLKYQLKDPDFASTNLARLYSMGTAFMLDCCLLQRVPDPLLDDWLDRLALDPCLQSVYLLDDDSNTFHAMRRGLKRLGMHLHTTAHGIIWNCTWHHIACSDAQAVIGVMDCTACLCTCEQVLHLQA